MFQSFSSLSQAIEKQRFAADLRHYHRLSGLCDAAGYAFSHLIFDPACSVFIQAVRSDNAQFICVSIKQHHRATDHPVMSPEYCENTRHRVLELERPGQHLSGFQKCRQLSRLSLFGCHLCRNRYWRTVVRPVLLVNVLGWIENVVIPSLQLHKLSAMGAGLICNANC